jgi:hypothetical protein
MGGGYGICNNINSSPFIKYNIIQAGSGALSFGIYNVDSSSPFIYSNIIHGGFGNKVSYGIYNKDNSVPVIRNNTISGGCSKGTAHGIYIYRSPGLIIENNIIFVSGGQIQYCIYEYYFDNPEILRHNLLFGSTFLYHDDDLGEFFSIDQVNNQAGVITERSNISQDDPHFLQPENYDDPNTEDYEEWLAEGYDWHLTPVSSIDIKAGGLNLAEFLLYDLDNNRRTTDYKSMHINDPTIPDAGGWSLGAYEFDQ